MRYVALLRGINVGGNNLIKMAALRTAFEAMGFEDVSTYIASGNVLFTAPRSGQAALESRIENHLSKAFGYDARVLVRSAPQLRRTIPAAPKGWPRPDTRSYVVFVKAPLTPKKALQVAPPREGVDTVAIVRGALLYGSRRDALTRTGLQKALTTPEYQRMTIRELRTCIRILAMMDAA